MRTGIILAGGATRIAEKDIPLLQFRNEKVLDRQMKELKKACREIIIVAKNPFVFLPFVPDDVRVITDFHKNHGTLGGMHAGLSLAKNEQTWIVSCDMPFLSSLAAEYMSTSLKKGARDAVIPVINHKPYPFHGLYNRERTLKHVNKMIANKDISVDGLLDKLTWEPITESECTKQNIDSLFVYRVHSKQELSDADAFQSKSKW